MSLSVRPRGRGEGRAPCRIVIELFITTVSGNINAPVQNIVLYAIIWRRVLRVSTRRLQYRTCVKHAVFRYFGDSDEGAAPSKAAGGLWSLEQDCRAARAVSAASRAPASARPQCEPRNEGRSLRASEPGEGASMEVGFN